MSIKKDLQPGEILVELPDTFDAGLYFVGRIRTAFKTLKECPRNGHLTDSPAVIELDQRYAAALKDIELYSHLIVLYWLDHSTRDLLRQMPRHVEAPRGTFALRSPIRPNPIAVSIVQLVSVKGVTLTVRHLDCLDGTPLLDIKPYLPDLDSVPEARVP